MTFRCTVLLMTVLLATPFSIAGEPEALNRPEIVKHGTIDLDLVECTPVVFKGRLYRFEYVRKGYKPNTTGDSYFRFIDVETNKPTTRFAEGYHLGSAFVDGDTIYVSGVDIWGGNRIELFYSTDMKNWQSRTALNVSKYEIFNTSICRGENGYVMMFEIGGPPEESGSRFTARFAISSDLLSWTITPPECVYSKDRYTAPHCLRYLDGYFYNFYLEAYKGYEMRVVRSKDLVHWEASPLNPVLRHSPDDKKIANPKLTTQQQKIIKEAKNINNSDIDFCEYQGRTVILYSWGNQQGVEFLAEASYAGTEDSFIRSWFPETKER